MHDPRRTAAAGILLAAAGILLTSPPFQRAALRVTSVTTGHAAAGLRTVSLAAGLRYVDLAYPPEEDTDEVIAR